MCSRICSSKQELDDLFARLKITPCPHCKRVGSLIKHGFLRGYDQQHQLNKIFRAARVFCSNRYERHRKGAVIVYDKGRRLGQARLLDAVANGLARRREQ